jgi:hypothetical protein
MTTIQYIIPIDYGKEQTVNVASTFYTNLIRAIKKLKHIKFEKQDFVIYPVNSSEILKYKKLLMTANDRGKPLLEALDELFLEDLTKENLKVERLQNATV